MIKTAGLKMTRTGIEWAPQIPEGWAVRRVGDIASVVNGYPFNSSLFNPTTGFPLVRIRDINKSVTEAYYSGEPVLSAVIHNGELVIGMDGDFNVARWSGNDALLNQRLCAIRSESSSVQSLLRYILPMPLQIINDLTYSTTVKHLSSFQVEKIRFPLPPDDDVAAILDFLDRETAEADALVAKYKRLIELLEEKRAALITRAVTKGLDPNVSMKDSGIEWIGPVPEHWNVSPVRRIAKNVETGGTPPETDFSSDGMPWYTPGDFRSEIDLAESEKHVSWNAASVRTFPRGSILVVGIGATLGKIGIPPRESSSNQQCNAIIPYDDLNRRFLAYALVASYDEMRSRASSSTLPILNQSKTKALELPIAPRVEQDLIAKWIDSCFAETGTLIETTNRAIALVQEHRSALITAVVTGQIDVTKYSSKNQPVAVRA